MTSLYVNLSLPEMLNNLMDFDFDGIGLLRLEFLITTRIGKHPLALFEESGGEEYYIETISRGVGLVAEAIYPKPVVVRFSDFKSDEYSMLEGSEKYEPKESNPALGLRGVARYLSPQLGAFFPAECKAIRQVSDRFNNLRLLLPFVRAPWEVQECLNIMRASGLALDSNLPVWLMAEVPSVVLNMDQFNELPIAGYSIGTNDLYQLLFGIGRDQNSIEQDRYFYPQEPVLARSIGLIIDGAKRANKTVSICGEWPSLYPEIIPQLVTSGIDSISVNVNVLKQARGILQEMSMM